MKTLGISELTANLAGTFGTCIGQNACAGVYPTFLAILAAIAQKRDVWSIEFLAQLVLYIVISSIGSAGVGGGALNNSLIVLNLFGLPVQIVLTMMSFDPIIQMGRIVVNLSGCLLAGFVTERIDKEINFDILYDRISLDELEEKDPSVEPLIGESLLRSNGSGCNYCTGVCQTK
jgi:L-cystine uptake protein TcyP (sodium:dicarboxylate symporter family)